MTAKTQEQLHAQAKARRARGPVGQYFSDLWAGIVTTYVGMKLTLGYMVSKPFTMQYPEVKPVIPPTHRGLHAIKDEDCTLCQMCVRTCPVDCISLEGLGRARDSLLLTYKVDYSKCLFCNLCAEACPTSCVRLTEKFNLASGARKDCILEIARPKSDDEIAAFNEKLAQKEAEKKAKQAQKESESAS